MRTATGVLSICLGLAATGCVQERPFRCETANECVIGEARGLCQLGYCAYFDSQCPGDLRFEQSAGDGLAGQCVAQTEQIDCELFCDVWGDACGGVVELYEDIGACMGACEVWGVDPAEPDSVGCRYDAVLEAQRSDDAAGCLDGSPSGGDACRGDESPSCLEYCELAEDRCGGVGELPEGHGCMDACLSLYPGVWGAGEGDTIACRISALQDFEDELACTVGGFEPVEPCAG